MKRNRSQSACLFVLITSLIILCTMAGFRGPRTAAASDHALWNSLLREFVEDGRVNYSGFKKKEELLDTYLEFLDKTDPFSLGRKEQLVLFINAYNAYTVKLILDNFQDGKPVASIKKIGGFFSGPWSIKFCRLGGEVYSLDNIEHDILRPKFNEPRIHFAVNCASKGCPPLLNEAYEADKLEDQLSQVTLAFLQDKKRNYLKKNSLYVSKIFSWFAEDFEPGVVSFFMEHGGEEMRKVLEGKKDSLEVKFVDYDWSLNTE